MTHAHSGTVFFPSKARADSRASHYGGNAGLSGIIVADASRRHRHSGFLPSAWLMNRLRAGFCEVPNPFNPAQVSRVSLRAEDVDAIVFWTKNPQPMIEHIAELERAGLRFYFQFSLHDYPALLETASAAGCRKNRRVQATEQDDRRGARYLAL